MFLQTRIVYVDGLVKYDVAKLNRCEVHLNEANDILTQLTAGVIHQAA